jgi:SHS2 domain-containing protein
MSYKVLGHTADVRLVVKAATFGELITESVKGLMHILQKARISKKPSVVRFVSLSSGDKTSLLVDFLNEVLTRAQTYKEIYTNVILKKISDTSLEAELSGVPVQEFEEDIKAVTYHEAAVQQDANGKWHTTLVLDI